MENWKRFVNESTGVWKSQNIGKVKGRTVYRLVHMPSGMVISTSYYKTSRKDVKELIKFLEDKAEEMGWNDISSDNPSEETIISIHNTIISSDFKRDSMKYTVAVNIGDS